MEMMMRSNHKSFSSALFEMIHQKRHFAAAAAEFFFILFSIPRESVERTTQPKTNALLCVRFARLKRRRRRRGE